VVPGDHLLIDPSSAPDSEFLPAAGGRCRGERQKTDVSLSAQTANEFIVVHDGNCGESTKLSEQFRGDEQGLISVWHLEESRPEVDAALDDTKGPAGGIHRELSKAYKAKDAEVLQKRADEFLQIMLDMDELLVSVSKIIDRRSIEIFDMALSV